MKKILLVFVIFSMMTSFAFAAVLLEIMQVVA